MGCYLIGTVKEARISAIKIAIKECKIVYKPSYRIKATFKAISILPEAHLIQVKIPPPVYYPPLIKSGLGEF